MCRGKKARDCSKKSQFYRHCDPPVGGEAISILVIYPLTDCFVLSVIAMTGVNQVYLPRNNRYKVLDNPDINYSLSKFSFVRGLVINSITYSFFNDLSLSEGLIEVVRIAILQSFVMTLFRLLNS